MKYSVGVECALHCLLYMVDLPAGQAVGIKDLALYQGVSETYLSKVFTRLRKAGLIQAAPGVKGGYRLLAKPEEITFWGVVEAIEGAEPLFQCQEIRQRELLLDQEHLPDAYTKCPCLINTVMQEGENQLRQYLNSKTLAWLHQQVATKIPQEHKRAMENWFAGKR